jgi:hypothetical protein
MASWANANQKQPKNNRTGSLKNVKSLAMLHSKRLNKLSSHLKLLKKC